MKNLARTVVTGLALALGAMAPAQAVELDQGAAGTCNNLTTVAGDTAAWVSGSDSLLSSCNPIPLQYDGIARNLTVRVNNQSTGPFHCQVTGWDDSNNQAFTQSGDVFTVGAGAPINALSIPLNVFFITVQCNVPGRNPSNNFVSSILGFELVE